MLFPLFEGCGYIESVRVESAVAATATKEIKDSANLNLNLPYGNQSIGFTAGMIGQLVSDGGDTAVEVSDGSSPLVIFADSFVDTTRSGKVSVYYLNQGNKFRVQGDYDTSQTYAVNTLLTVVPSGANKGKLTPASNYGNQPIVGIVIVPPANASNDDPMDIMTLLQAEAVV